MAHEVKIFSGRATRYLAENIARSFGVKLGEVQVTEFSDGEFTVSFEENLRGKICLHYAGSLLALPASSLSRQWFFGCRT